MTTVKGSCLCGAVRYAVERFATAIGHCHCATCRKAHAAAFASTARVMRGDFHWLSGEGKLTSFESSPGKLRRFCSVCGAQILAEWTAQPYVILRVATLDEDPGVRPAVHIWTSHSPAWLSDPADIVSFPEGPPGR
jgi:hypothetical protein